MKKKITSLLVIVALALGTLALAGCGWFEANSISFVTPPATTYVLSETTDAEGNLDFVLEVNGEEYSYNKYKDRITVSNFITDTVGTRTAYVEFDGKFKLSFTYTVLDGRYSGGTGTQTDPYLVSTPAQFQNLLNEKKFNYYKLTKSIDFTGVTLNMANYGKSCTPDEVWAGYIDGAGYGLLNLNTLYTPQTVSNPNGSPANKYLCLFGRVGSTQKGGFTLKNITINFAGHGSSALIGTCFANGDGAEILFDNVRFTGYVSGSCSSDSAIAAGITNPGKLFDDGAYAKPNNALAAYKSITFKDCENSVKIMDTFGTTYVAGYFGGNNGCTTGEVVFDNCSFSGSIDGAGSACAVFATHAAPGTPNGNTYSNMPRFTFNNCKVKSGAGITGMSGAKNGLSEIYSFSDKTMHEVTDGITNEVGSSLISTMPKLTITKVNDTKFTVTLPSGVEAATYKVFVKGSLTNGDFRCAHPVNRDNDGKFNLYTFKLVNELTDNTIDYGFGSTRFVLDGNVVTYYAKGVNANPSLNVTGANVIVIAYDSSNNAVACAISTDKFNLKAA